MKSAIARGLSYAPYADLLWCETSKPHLGEAREFAEAIHAKFPGKMLAYNCSPSFNWRKNLDDATIARFQKELGAMGYKFQFITLAGFHALNHSMYELARNYKAHGMTAYCGLQDQEFASEKESGYEAVKHQRFVGTGYFDSVQQVITSGTVFDHGAGRFHRSGPVPRAESRQEGDRPRTATRSQRRSQTAALNRRRGEQTSPETCLVVSNEGAAHRVRPFHFFAWQKRDWFDGEPHASGRCRCGVGQFDAPLDAAAPEAFTPTSAL